MYERSQQRSATGDISSFVDGYDLFNSKLITILGNVVDRLYYTITNYEYRPDLICKEIYGSEDYLTIFLMLSGMSTEDFTKGSTVPYINKNVLDSIMERI